MTTSLMKIYRILELLEEYSDNSTSDNIKARLDKCFQLYLKDIDVAYYGLIDNINRKSVIKEMSKCK